MTTDYTKTRQQIVSDWLMNSFRLVEIVVSPTAQGQGLGLLHDCLLSGLAHPKAVLSTLAADTNAYRMYRKRGWVVLLDDLFFPGVARPYRTMGLKVSRLTSRRCESVGKGYDRPQRRACVDR